MNGQWFLSRNGQQYGPYSKEDLVDLYQTGNIFLEDLFWDPISKQWINSTQIDLNSFYPASNSDNFLEKRKRIIFISLIALILTSMLVGLVVWVIHQKAPVYLSSTGRSPETQRAPISQGDQKDETTLFLDELESTIHEEELVDWRNFKDLKQEQGLIQITMDTFIQSLKQQDTNAAVALIAEDKKIAYQELFNSRPEAMESFAEIISQVEMSFLSSHSPTEPKNRTAEYKVTLDDFTFYVIFMKIEDAWVLYDF